MLTRVSGALSAQLRTDGEALTYIGTYHGEDTVPEEVRTTGCTAGLGTPCCRGADTDVLGVCGLRVLTQMYLGSAGCGC